jgi:ribosomal protein S21
MAQRVIVEVRNGDVNKALKIFKKKTIKSGHIQELKDRKEYVKPTTAKRKATATAKRRQEMEVLMERWESGGLKHNPFVNKVKKSAKPKTDENNNK